MEEVGFRVVPEILRQALVLRLQGGQIRLLEGVGVVLLPHHRLHRDIPSDGCQRLHVLGKVLVESCKGAPEVVVLRPTALNELLELGHNHVIAARAGHGLAELIVDRRAPVE